ncbi:MAG: AgmX/PglI C-terminal domain-containing protein [Pseudobdellovibrio sp.]
MKNRVVIGLIVTGLILILASVLMPTRSFNFFSSNNIATINEISSELSQGVVTHGLDQYDDIPAKKGMKLRHLDLIKTSSLSEASITLNQTGGEFRIQENSEVLLEQIEDGTVLITVRSGDIIIEKFGKSPSFWVRKDGRQLTATDYALSNETNLETLRKSGQKVIKEQEGSLQQAKIEEILTSKKSDFFRCYGQLIQKTEQAHGQVLVSFEINNSGKVTKVDINRSDITDNAFKACVSEVVARTIFPKFNGPSITTVFPLKFD